MNDEEFQSAPSLPSEPVWTGAPLWVDLANAANLLEADPAATEKQVRDICKLVPGQPHAVRLLVDALRTQGDVAGAQAALEALAAEYPNLAIFPFELGALLSELGERDAAIRALSRTVELEPKHPAAWRILGDCLADSGDTAAAARAYARQFASAIADLRMLESMSALGPEQANVAGGMVREFLKIYPTDVFALHLMGQLYMRANLLEPAEKLFARALDLAPDFARARQDYLSALHQQQKWQAEIAELDKLLEEEPNNPDYRFAKSMATLLVMDYPTALGLFESLVKDHPGEARCWGGYANALRSLGRRDECVAAYRKGIEVRSDFGAGWWGLADLMGYDFSAADVEAMRAQLAREDLAPDDRYHLHFALGEALERKERYEESFGHYRKANALRRAQFAYNADDISANVGRIRRQYTREFFEAHAGKGCEAPDAIFIVGLPRSGSTLVEQILSSHESIEGAGELPSLVLIAARLEIKDNVRASSGEGEKPSLDDEDLRALGEEYLKETRVYRRLGRPFFTDKTPSNFHHMALICAALPNAKIIDVRRHPMACCFSNYKQHFPWGFRQTYDLSDIGRYYRDYVDLMAHFDAVLPGRVHRVFYEDLVRNTEHEVRRLFDYCGVSFEPKALRFFENERGVVTVSSEQVRKPMYNTANEQWRHYERWLGPLKAALSPLPDIYPDVPEQS